MLIIKLKIMGRIAVSLARLLCIVLILSLIVI